MVTYWEAFRRDVAILRGPCRWRRTALIFGCALAALVPFVDVDLVRVEHASLLEVLLVDDVLLLLACTAGFVARWGLSPLAYLDARVPAESEDALEAERRVWRQKFTENSQASA